MTQNGLLTDPHRVRGDMQLIGQAIKDERFDIPDELLAFAPSRVHELIQSDNARIALRATQLLIAMVNSNKPKVQAHLHQHQSTYGPLIRDAEGVTVEQRRSDNAGRIAALERFSGNG